MTRALLFKKDRDGCYSIYINTMIDHTNRSVGYLERQDDGFFQWFPPEIREGSYISEHFLREIVNKLEELNEGINRSLDKYFKNLKEEDNEDSGNW